MSLILRNPHPMKQITLILSLVLFSAALSAQNIIPLEEAEASLKDLKKKDDLRTFAIYLIKQRDSLTDALNNQLASLHETAAAQAETAGRLEQQLALVADSLSLSQKDFDQAMTSIEALNENKIMLETKNTNLLADIEALQHNVIELEEQIANHLAEAQNAPEDNPLVDSLWNILHPPLQWSAFPNVFEDAHTTCRLEARSAFSTYFQDVKERDEVIEWERSQRLDLGSSTLYLDFYGGSNWTTYVSLTEISTTGCSTNTAFDQHNNQSGLESAYQVIQQENPIILGKISSYGGRGIQESSLELLEYANKTTTSLGDFGTIYYDDHANGYDTVTYQWKEIRVLLEKHNGYPTFEVISKEEKRISWDDTEATLLPSTSAIYLFDGSQYVLVQGE